MSQEMNNPLPGEGPTEKVGSSLPIVLGVIGGTLLLVGGWYLAMRGGWGKGSGSPGDAVRVGQMLYSSAGCASCHQADGRGMPGLIPPLAQSEWVNGDPDRLYRILLHGLNGSVSIGGQTYNGVMPGFADRYNDHQIAAVLTFIRTNAAWGNKASAVSPEAVATARQAAGNRRQPWTAEELKGEVRGPGGVGGRPLAVGGE